MAEQIGQNNAGQVNAKAIDDSEVEVVSKPIVSTPPITPATIPTKGTVANPPPAQPARMAATPGAKPVTQAAPVRAATPAFMIQDIEDMEEWQNIMVYADYGAGKTHFGCTSCDVPEMGDVLYVSAEGGEKTARKWKNIDVIRLNTYSQMARIYEFLKIHCQARDNNDESTLRKLESNFRQYTPERAAEVYAKRNAKRYKTVIIDSLSELHKYCMYQLLGIKIGEYKLDMEPDSPQFAEWGRSSEMIRLLVRTFRDLNMHVIMICARDYDQDETKKYHYMPMLPGKLGKEIQGFFDTVGYLVAAPNENTGAIQRRMFLTPGRNYQAKNRYKNFSASYLDNVTMADLIKLELS